jgi:signal transduction histidine kinase
MQQRNGKKQNQKVDKPAGVSKPAGGEAVAAPMREMEMSDRLTELGKTNRQLRRKVFDLYTIFEISRNFNAVLDYDLLLETFIFTCLGQLGSAKGAIFLRPHINAREYRLAKTKGSGVLPTIHHLFRIDTKLTRYLAKLNRPVLVSELPKNLTPPDEREILNGFDKGVVVPLIYQTRLSGLFLIADKISETPFSPDDIEFLSALGNQISVAIENARLYEAERTAIEQLRAAQQQLVQTERLAALGEMSAKIAHEVNNPLGIIKNYIQLLKRMGGGKQEIDDYTEILSQEIDRIANIVGQLREFQRPIRMELEEVDVRRILDDTLVLTERQLRSEGIKVERKWERGSYTVNGSADALKQVFLNIIINARSAMEGGGTLTVCVDRLDDQVVILFCDTGPGIPPNIVPKIFEPFFTTKGDKGTGLGLSVCHGIIKSHQGSIRYKDGGPGGCFEVVIPLLHGH